jgi:putative ABC transport system permease protein
MLKNYLKIAWRNLIRYKVYSFINITGLAIGLAVCMLIVLYVGHEKSYDQFHTHSNRIFWMQTKLKLGADSVFMQFLNYSAAPVVGQREPSVESFLRIRKDDRSPVIMQNPEQPSLKFAESRFMFADSNFFSFFSFKLLQGDKDRVLQNPLSVVISKRAAQKYFGKQDPVGKMIRYNNSDDLLITGVAENAPSNSSIEYDFIASLSGMRVIKDQQNLVKDERNDFLTYFLIQDKENIAKVEKTLFHLAKEKEAGADPGFRYIGVPMAKLHLNTGTDMSNLKYLDIFPFVAAFILLLALINYMSLSTARSAIRAREIGVRKVMGADRKLIATQFFMESALYTSIAFILGYVLCIFFQPYFFNFLQIDVDTSFLYQPQVLFSFLILFVLTVVIAGAYPSVLLSAYKPVAVLYGKFRQGSSISVRQFFTTFQFAIAVVFIICGIVMQKQMHFFRYTDTGITRENVVMLPFGKSVSKHYTAFKEEVQAIPGLAQVSIALRPLYKGYDMMGIRPAGSGEMILMPMLDVDQHFISMLGLKWKLPPADSFFYARKNNVILNEAAVERLNLGQVSLYQKVDNLEVAGVVKDFNWSSLQNKIQGLLLSVRSDQDTTSLWAKNGGCLFVKVKAGTNIPTVIDHLKKVHKKYDDENPFDYYFMDDAYEAMYKAEARLAELLTFFTGLAIIIACLGLFGLVTFMAMQRTKEIAIRKTLGASVQNIVRLLSIKFILLVLVAVIMASPVAWYFMNKWLQGFAYRVAIEWWIFIVSAVIAVLIALMTVSFQAVKAAIINPVKLLRTE